MQKGKDVELDKQKSLSIKFPPLEKIIEAQPIFLSIRKKQFE
jgi:hypothetical protein